MYELSKKLAHETHYWKVWKYQKRICVEYGVIGVSKESEEIQLKLFDNGSKLMKRLVEEKRSQGYVNSDEKEAIDIVILNDNGVSEYDVLKKASFELYEMIEKELMETSIGFPDGVNINDESRVIITCFVEDMDIAIQRIRQVISGQKLINVNQISLDNGGEPIDVMVKDIKS